MTRDEWVPIFEALVAAWPATQATAATAKVWLETLADLDAKHVELAARRLMAEARPFMPSVGELRAAALEVADPQPPIPDADEALAELFGEIRRVGWNGTPSLSPPVAAAVAAVGGWWEVCCSEPAVLRRHFADAYKATRARCQRERDTAQLPAPIRHMLEIAAAQVSMPRELLPPRRPHPERLPADGAAVPSRIGKAIDALGRPQRAPKVRVAESPEDFERCRAAQLAALERWMQNQERRSEQEAPS